MQTLSEQVDYIKKNITLQNLQEKKEGLPHVKWVFNVHEKAFGNTCKNCPSLISGYLSDIKKYDPKKNTMNKLKIKLIDNLRLIYHDGKAYSNHNLTDKVATEFIKIDPEKRNLLFTKLEEETKLKKRPEKQTKTEEQTKTEV